MNTQKIQDIDTTNAHCKEDQKTEDPQESSTSQDESFPQNNDFQKIETSMDLKKEIRELFERISALEADKQKKEDLINTQNSRINILERDNISLKENIVNLNSEIKTTNGKVKQLELLIKRNNINLNLIGNRDLIKTIVLLFGLKRNIDLKNYLVKDNKGKYTCSLKFTSLVAKVLKELSTKLDKYTILRPGFELSSDDISKKEKIQKQLIFIECCHFVVCTIDNIVHPQEEKETQDVFSQLAGQKALSKLKEALKLFFNDPGSIDSLEKLLEFSQVKELTIQRYIDAKKKAFDTNKEYWNSLGKNTYYESFFIEYLFSPKEASFDDTHMATNSEEFIKNIENVLNDSKSIVLPVMPLEKFIVELKWN